MDAAAFAESFLRPRLFSTSYAHGFGTLYTAVYRVGEEVVEYRWPTFAWRLSFDAFHEAEHVEVLAEPTFVGSVG